MITGVNTGAVNHGDVTIERLDPRLMTGEPTYLFNIYGVEEIVNTGSTGTFFIPACPRDKEYIRAPQSIPGTVEDIYPHFNDKEYYRARPTVGEDIVKAVLGIGLGATPQENRTRFGWFSSKSKVPSKQELAEAKSKLVEYLQFVLREADEFASSSDPKMRESISDKHFRAAEYMNVTRPWQHKAEAMTICPFCSTAVRPGSSRCAGCNEIIDVAAYEATKARLAKAV